MFGKKRAYDVINEGQRHKQEKEELTHQFHRSLKSLQQKEHVDGATIVSNEASNNLCNVLEAVFLHGVKDNMMSKLVSYAQGVQTEVKLNFWNVVKKFTHKDVIVQLKDLSQINSDVGLCRAWVRLAINDGLMSSYLASMLADSKAMQTFYHPWAYLLDYEQPDILRNHLTGLMGLNFNLSLNSSILNTWGPVTISLAGLVTQTATLAPVIRSGNSTPPSSQQESQTSGGSADSASTRTGSILGTSAGAAVSAPVSSALVCQPPDVTCTPPNTPADPSFFTKAHDLDILRRFGEGSRLSGASSSSSGQASCPDPGESYDGGGGGFSPRSSRNASPRYSPLPPSMYMSREERKRDEELKLKTILQYLDQKELQREQEAREREEREREEREKEEREREKRAAEERKRAEEKLQQKREAGRDAESPRSLQTTPAAKHKRQLEEDSQTKAGEGPAEEAVDGRQGGALPQQAEAEGMEGLTSDKGCLEEAALDAAKPLERDQQPSSLPLLRGGQEEEEEEEWKERESSFGNSLNAMDGWSTTSPYSHHHHHHQQPNYRPQWQTSNESYVAMLQGYHAQQGRGMGMATVQQVIDNLPGAGAGAGPLSQTDNGDRETGGASEVFAAEDAMWPLFWQPDDDIDFTDYEIIHTPEEASDALKLEQMKVLCSYLGKNTQNNVCATPSCNAGVGFFHGPGITCSFDGRTYCEQCHLSQTAHIPAEIVFNWSFKKRKVCAENYKFLQRMQDQPVLDLEEMSTSIYSMVPLMNNVMVLRTQLTSLRSYMFTCSESTAAHLRDWVWPREHLYNKVHTYSVNDLLEARAGKLEVFMKEAVEQCKKHVYSCTLCMAKGFYCELCQEPTPIFPFQISSTVKCKSCKNVYHSRCKTDGTACPKCIRYAQRGVRRQKDDDDDYACSPEL